MDSNYPKLKEEFHYFLDHHDEMVEKYNGKFVVIKDQKVIGVYDDMMQAFQATAKFHPVGTFIIQKCAPEKESYTQTFHSRVSVE